MQGCTRPQRGGRSTWPKPGAAARAARKRIAGRAGRRRQDGARPRRMARIKRAGEAAPLQQTAAPAAHAGPRPAPRFALRFPARVGPWRADGVELRAALRRPAASTPRADRMRSAEAMNGRSLLDWRAERRQDSRHGRRRTDATGGLLSEQ
jgi:hypothetical protein